jgi:hypothetical protein
MWGGGVAAKKDDNNRKRRPLPIYILHAQFGGDRNKGGRKFGEVGKLGQGARLIKSIALYLKIIPKKLFSNVNLVL